MADVCLCQYTLSGHCGLEKKGKIDNDSSLGALARIAVSQAEAGVDVVSPSAMMDGQVATIRAALDDAGYENVAIMSHSAKHRSSFYAPFRNAAECAPKFGDRKTYQVPYTNAREAASELQTDYDEGVDMLMIKPALAYLDLVAEAKKRFNVPIAAYSVSGEFALVKAAVMQGWVDEDAITHEILSSIKRAGADIIITYFARRGFETELAQRWDFSALSCETIRQPSSHLQHAVEYQMLYLSQIASRLSSFSGHFFSSTPCKICDYNVCTCPLYRG